MEKIVIRNRHQKISHKVLISNGEDTDIVSISLHNIPQNVRQIYILMGGDKTWTYLRSVHFTNSLKITQPIPTRKCKYHHVHIGFDYDDHNVESEYIHEYEYQLDDECQTVYDECEDRYVTGRVARMVLAQKEIYYLMAHVPDMHVERGHVETQNIIPFWEYCHYSDNLKNPILLVEKVTDDIYRVQNFVRFVGGMSGRMYVHGLITI